MKDEELQLDLEELRVQEQPTMTSMMHEDLNYSIIEKLANTNLHDLIGKNLMKLSRSKFSFSHTATETTLSPWHQEYIINNQTFRCDDIHYNENVSYSLAIQKRTSLKDPIYLSDEDENQAVYCSSSESQEYEDDTSETQELKFTMTEVPHGVLINSKLFLTNEQWNTQILVKGNVFYCAVCDLIWDSNDGHSGTDRHRLFLDSYKPLKRFKMSITRKIDGQYHCAVCNLMVEVKSANCHYSSKAHRSNLNYAMNKVFHLNGDNINNDNDNSNGNTDNDNGNSVNDNGNSVKDNGNNFNDYHNGSNFIDIDVSSDTDSTRFNFASDSIWGYGKEKSEFSYASALKKNKPRCVDKFNGKRVKVTFDSYNMFIKPKDNTFYCMTCKEYGRANEKIEHSKSLAHVDKLNKCAVNVEYGDYYVRKLDDAFHHCGHCNNLVLNNDVQKHLHEKHKRKVTNINDASLSNSNGNADNGNKNSDSADNGNKINDIACNGNNDNACNGNKNNESADNGNTSSNSADNGNKSNHVDSKSLQHEYSLDDYILLTVFGFKVAVNWMSYNFVKKGFVSYYCGLCDSTCMGDSIKGHIKSEIHMKRMQSTYFIPHFNCSLVRFVRSVMHCAICNIPVQPYFIVAHIQEPIHITLLSNALHYNATIFPHNNIPYPQAVNIQNATIGTNVVKPIENSMTNDPKLIEVNMTEISVTDGHKQTIETDGAIRLDNVTGNLATDSVKSKLTTETGATVKIKKPRARNMKNAMLTEPSINTEAIESKVKKPKASKVSELTIENEETSLTMDNTTETASITETSVPDYMYLKRRKKYFKISIASYNSLVQLGDCKYCFVCSEKLCNELIKEHIESKVHKIKLKKCAFIDCLEDVLFRQINLTYQCATCNVLVSKKQLEIHKNWSKHITIIAEMQKISKTKRKQEVKSGITLVPADTQKEIIYDDTVDSNTEVVFIVKIQEMGDDGGDERYYDDER